MKFRMLDLDEEKSLLEVERGMLEGEKCGLCVAGI